MSAAPPAAPPPSSLAIVFAAILHVAFVIAASGVVALLLNRDVIDYPDAGPILGPAMIAAGGIVVAVAARSTSRARPWFGALAGAIGAVAATVVVGAVGYAMVRGELAWVVLAAGHFALSPLAAVTFVSAFVALAVGWSFARLPRVPHESSGE